MFVSRIITNRNISHRCLTLSSRLLATSTATETVKPQKFFRTEENDPTKHDDLHHGLFYTIPQDVANKLFVLGGLDKEQQAMMKTFQETSLMVRKPALDIIKSLKETDFSQPPKRYVLHGRIGAGKSFTLNHLLHYGYSNKYVLVYCGKPTDWVRFPQEYSVSTTNSKRIDTPLDAAVWLQHFKAQNFKLLEELNLKSLNKYTWSAREITNPGDTILSIVEHGINRIKHASDCVAVILKELKLNSAEGNCRLMVAIEKVNSFYEECDIRYPDRTIASVDDVTLARGFKKFLNQEWKNGALITTVDKKLVVPYRILPLSSQKKKNPNDRTYKHWGPFNVRDVSDLPNDLLTETGVRDFGSFESIPVEKFTNKELMSCLDYYEDRHWIQRAPAKSDEGREEISFLSGNNPGHVYEFCCTL